MAHTIEIDWAGEYVEVAWASGAQPFKRKLFDSRADAGAFADSKLGKRQGMIINNLDLTPEQRLRQAERKARIAALFS